MVLYLRGREGRGIGLLQKLSAYRLQDSGRDTVDANPTWDSPPMRASTGPAPRSSPTRGEDAAAPDQQPGQAGGSGGYGMRIVDRIPWSWGETEQNRAYLQTKADRMGHVMTTTDDELPGHPRRAEW